MTEIEIEPEKVKKVCPRCTYSKVISGVDYKKSAQNQKIYFRTFKVCCRCNYIRPYEYAFPYCVFELDNYPKELIDVDLTKIIHIHNHNEFSGTEDIAKYDDKGKCIELTIVNRYKCDFCGKLSDYTEIKEQYNLNNPCDKMKKLTKKEKGRIKYRNKHKGKNKENKYTDDKGRMLVEENKLMLIVTN